MLFKIKLIFAALTTRMWPKIGLYALFSAVTAISAVYFKRYIPDSVSYSIDRDTIGSILNILASSMLAVTTFSLSTMVAAWSSATTNVTPRATRLLMRDQVTQSVLATFIGSFIFALVGIICLGFGIYEGGGRLILFVTTVVVVFFILVTLIRWIDHLSTLGRVGETTRLVECETGKSLQRRAAKPFLGSNPLRDPDKDIPKSATRLCPNGCGYVQTIDMEKLCKVATDCGVQFYISGLPGRFVSPDRDIVWVDGELKDEARETVLGAFVIKDERDYDQDPRFGMCVLSEIAVGALPRDTGTAIDVIGRITRLLVDYAEAKGDEAVQYENIWAPPLLAKDLYLDAFNAISREAVGLFEVHARLQKAFDTLSRVGDHDFRAEALKFAEIDLKRAGKQDLIDEETNCLREISPLHGS